MITSFTQLEAWQSGFQLMKIIYTLTKQFPSDERFGLTNQLRRAAVSILANIAEGFNRSTSPDKAHKYTIARGECAEIEALLLISTELGYVTAKQLTGAIYLTNVTAKLVTGLIHYYSKP